MAKGKHKARARQEPTIGYSAEQDNLVHETLASIRARLLARARRAAALGEGKFSRQDPSWDLWLGTWGGSKGRWHDC
jgi:hypothetical protein